MLATYNFKVHYVVMSEKVCKDCPLYTSRGLYNSSRRVKIDNAAQEGITSQQDFIPMVIASANT